MPVNSGRQTRTGLRLRSPDSGKLSGMKVSDLVGVPFHAGAALRHRRFFHPVGLVASGTLERVAPPGTGLPVESCPVVGRVSKGIGTPGALADFAGLAWRMPPNPFAATSWDVLLVSAGIAPAAWSLGVDRVLLRPVTSWHQAPYSSLMPLRYEDRLWWVRARLRPGPGSAHDANGLAIDTIRDAVNGDGLVFDIEQACGAGGFAPLALLTLKGEPAGEDREISFDPIRHSAPNVTLWPDWLRDVRESAYEGSRDGRRDG